MNVGHETIDRLEVAVNGLLAALLRAERMSIALALLSLVNLACVVRGVL